jgi:hypothetical protein
MFVKFLWHYLKFDFCGAIIFVDFQAGIAVEYVI